MLPILACRHARSRVQSITPLASSLWQLPVTWGDAEQAEASSSGRQPPHTPVAGHQPFKLRSKSYLLRGFAASAQPEPSPASSSEASASQAEPHSHTEHPPLSQDVVYYGPLSDTHKLLKRISIANTVIALLAAPAIIMFADASYLSRVGLATSLAMFGLLTTGALHWVTHPYVHELRYDAATQSFEARMTTLLGAPRIKRFKLSEVEPLPWNRPVATFMANGEFYYIDVYSFPDEELLKKLTPSDVPAGYKLDEDD